MCACLIGVKNLLKYLNWKRFQVTRRAVLVSKVMGLCADTRAKLGSAARRARHGRAERTSSTSNDTET